MAAIVLVGDPPPQRLISGWKQMPDDVPSDLERAVELFRSDLRQGYGIELPLIVEPGTSLADTDSLPPNRIEIVWEPRTLMDEDRTDISFPADNIMRITGGESGIIRTLFHLLEEQGGARYLFATENSPHIGFGAHFPERTSLSVPRTPVTRNNAYFPLDRHSGRTTYLSSVSGDRNRLYFWHWEARLGAKERLSAQHHLTKIAFPIEQYILSDEKPDDAIFPVLLGKRMLPWTLDVDLSKPWLTRAYRHGWQPCFSNRATEEEATRNLLAYLRENPDVRELSLAVNDNGGHCDCADCLALDSGEPNFLLYPNRSESYYRWVNRVAEQVAAEFPEVKLGVLAYREVITPPSFKMHPNVVVVLCMDFQTIMDPEVRKIWTDLVKEWASRDATLAVWSYNLFLPSYWLPRIFFSEMQQMLQILHEHGAVGAHEESYYFTAFSGPMHYVFYKLLENPYRNLEEVIQEWCDAAVGEAAGPYLRRYYAFLEDFWRNKATQTAWWNSRKAQYLSLSQTSYLYGLEPGDLAKCRALMEQVVAEADANGTDDQRRRAELLMAIFTFSEAVAIAQGAEYFAPNGNLPDAAAAVALLGSLSDAQKAYETAVQLPHNTEGWLVPNFATDRLPYSVPGLLAAASVWMSDPAVSAAFEALAQNTELEPRLRFLAGAMHKGATGGEVAGNLLPNSDFSSEEGAIGTGPDEPWTLRGLDGWQTWAPVHGRISRSDDVAFRGTHSLKCEIVHNNFRVLRRVVDIKPGTAYYFSARVFIPADQPVQEGRLILNSGPSRRHLDGFKSMSSQSMPEIALTPGQWNYIQQVIPTPDRRTDSLALAIFLKNFEPGDVVYIDDVQLLEVEAQP
jgi:hypothetical protein